MNLPIAAAIADQIISSIISSGPVGGILIWFMWRDSKKIDTMTEALNHLIQMGAIEVNSRPHITERTKQEIAALEAAVDRRRKTK